MTREEEETCLEKKWTWRTLTEHGEEPSSREDHSQVTRKARLDHSLSLSTLRKLVLLQGIFSLKKVKGGSFKVFARSSSRLPSVEGKVRKSPISRLAEDPLNWLEVRHEIS